MHRCSSRARRAEGRGAAAAARRRGGRRSRPDACSLGHTGKSRSGSCRGGVEEAVEAVWCGMADCCGDAGRPADGRRGKAAADRDVCGKTASNPGPQNEGDPPLWVQPVLKKVVSIQALRVVAGSGEEGGGRGATTASCVVVAGGRRPPGCGMQQPHLGFETCGPATAPTMPPWRLRGALAP
jgi:hypothetical protein